MEYRWVFKILKVLRIRPIYHRLRSRIVAPICISFTAYKVYEELERQLRIKRTTLNPEKAIECKNYIFGYGKNNTN